MLLEKETKVPRCNLKLETKHVLSSVFGSKTAASSHLQDQADLSRR